LSFDIEKASRTDLEMYVSVLNTQKSALIDDTDKLRCQLNEGELSYHYDVHLLSLLLQNLYSAQIQANSSQRRWRIARWGTWLAGVGKEESFETAFERASGW